MKKKSFSYDACVIAPADEKGAYVDLLIDRLDGLGIRYNYALENRVMPADLSATIERALKETEFVLVMVPSKPAKVAAELLPLYVKYPTRILAIFKDASFIRKADASKHNINYMLQKRDSVDRVALHFAGMFIGLHIVKE